MAETLAPNHASYGAYMFQVDGAIVVAIDQVESNIRIFAQGKGIVIIGIPGTEHVGGDAECELLLPGHDVFPERQLARGHHVVEAGSELTVRHRAVAVDGAERSANRLLVGSGDDASEVDGDDAETGPADGPEAGAMCRELVDDLTAVGSPLGL